MADFLAVTKMPGYRNPTEMRGVLASFVENPRLSLQSLTSGLENQLGPLGLQPNEPDQHAWRCVMARTQVARANRNQKMHGRSWVYFAQAGEGGPVKIGQSRQVDVRIRALAAANAREVTLLGTIPETVIPESYLLSCFGRHRLRGEWFMPVAELLALAEAGRRIYEAGYTACPADADEEAWDVIRPYAFRSRPGMEITRLNTIAGEVA